MTRMSDYRERALRLARIYDDLQECGKSQYWESLGLSIDPHPAFPHHVEEGELDDSDLRRAEGDTVSRLIHRIVILTRGRARLDAELTACRGHLIGLCRSKLTPEMMLKGRNN